MTDIVGNIKTFLEVGRNESWKPQWGSQTKPYVIKVEVEKGRQSVYLLRKAKHQDQLLCWIQRSLYYWLSL